MFLSFTSRSTYLRNCFTTVSEYSTLPWGQKVHRHWLKLITWKVNLCEVKAVVCYGRLQQWSRGTCSCMLLVHMSSLLTGSPRTGLLHCGPVEVCLICLERLRKFECVYVR